MDRYNPTEHTLLYNTRLAPGAMALRADRNPGKRRHRRERDSFLSNARAREAAP